MVKSRLSNKVEVRDKSLNGKGIFAKEDIKKGEIVFIKGGHILTKNEIFTTGVINKDTEIENCITVALNQNFKDKTLRDLYEDKKINPSIIDMKEQSILNNADITKEIDTGSCDRWKLLYNMLKGSYTEDDTHYGNYQSDKYEFVPNIAIEYKLKTDTEEFIIEHKCAFINEIKTRIILIQENSKLTI